MKTLIIDNYDSFTYNLYQTIGVLGGNPLVYRNDKVTLHSIAASGFTHIVISPGSGSACDESYFGICRKVILVFKKKVPILGVCLGHQGIIDAFGGEIVSAKKPMHGKQSLIFHTKEGIFANIPSPIHGMRYHSLIGKISTLPSSLSITARTKDNIIMGIEHKKYRIYGVQFHPESIGTKNGEMILNNFLNVHLDVRS